MMRVRPALLLIKRTMMMSMVVPPIHVVPSEARKTDRSPNQITRRPDNANVNTHKHRSHAFSGFTGQNGKNSKQKQDNDSIKNKPINSKGVHTRDITSVVVLPTAKSLHGGSVSAEIITGSYESATAPSDSAALVLAAGTTAAVDNRVTPSCIESPAPQLQREPSYHHNKERSQVSEQVRDRE